MAGYGYISNTTQAYKTFNHSTQKWSTKACAHFALVNKDKQNSNNNNNNNKTDESWNNQ